MDLTSLLLVDIGNTRIKWLEVGMASPSSQKLGAPGEMATSDATPGKFAALARKYSHHYLVLASVVPRLTPAILRAFKRRSHLVSAESRELGFCFDYPKPAELGADRLAAAAAIAAETIDSAIIVACGTATAFTVLDAQGRLCGGAIAPGPQTQIDSLGRAAAQLASTELRMPRHIPARSTADAIRAGVLLSFQGGVKETVAQLAASLGNATKPRVFVTGGYAHFLPKSLGLPHTLRPLLVFEGLRIIGNRIWHPAAT